MKSEPASLQSRAVYRALERAGVASGPASRICGNSSTAAYGNDRVVAQPRVDPASAARSSEARSSDRSRSSRGFSLIESLIALMLVTLALFLTLHLTSTQPRSMKTLRAHEKALRSIESVLETLRGGAIPLTEGRSRWTDPDDGALDDTTPGTLITLDVVAVAEFEALYSVTIEARYAIFGRLHVRRLQSMIWRPT